MENRIRKKITEYKIGKKNLFFYTNYKDYKDKNDYLNRIAEILDIGVDGIELCGNGLSDREFLELAKTTKQLCAEYSATFMIKSRADIAYLSSADCVNLKQDDLDILSVREVIGGEILIGCYINSQSALGLVKGGADYINLCQISSTPSEPVLKTGLEYAKWVSENTPFPVIFCGNPDMHDKLLSNCKIDKFAFDNSIFGHSSPNKVTVNLLNKIKKKSYN